LRCSRRLLALIALTGVLGTGCSLRMGDLTVATGKNVPVVGTTLRRGVEGSDCVHLALFIPLGSLTPNIQEATDRALEQVPEANALTNGAMYVDPFTVILYTRSCIRVKGDAMKIEQTAEGSR